MNKIRTKQSNTCKVNRVLGCSQRRHNLNLLLGSAGNFDRHQNVNYHRKNQNNRRTATLKLKIFNE
jgi:hypothetical protein